MFINRSDDTLDLATLRDDFYMAQSVTVDIPNVFLISDSYKSIRTKVVSWQNKQANPLQICGPKGTGKTLCLLALMSDEKVVPKVVPVFVSCSSFKNNSVTKYVLKLAKDHNIQLESNESISTWLVTLIKTEKFILFMDFNDLTDDKIVEDMITIAKYCCNFTVLAMSSGEGARSESFLVINQVFHKVTHFPFTEVEVDRFIEINKIALTKEELLPLTGNNPH